MGQIKVLITISQYAGQGARELPLELLQDNDDIKTKHLDHIVT